MFHFSLGFLDLEDISSDKNSDEILAQSACDRIFFPTLRRPFRTTNFWIHVDIIVDAPNNNDVKKYWFKNIDIFESI